MVTERTAKQWHRWYMAGPRRICDVAEQFKTTTWQIDHAFRRYAREKLRRLWRKGR